MTSTGKSEVLGSLVHHAAAEYTRRGWHVIPVPHRAKNPGFPGWQRLRLGETDLGGRFNGQPQNIGVLLGEPSGRLVDVDLDHDLAVELGPTWLPETGAIFGRNSKAGSHRLYYVTSPVETTQWRLADRRCVVELRSTGAQTVFPPSVHPSGEAIEWDINGEPATVDPQDLKFALARMDEEVRRQLGAPRPVAAATGRAPSGFAPLGVVERARRYLAKTPPSISGQGGHNAAFHAACVLVIGFGLGREQALTLLAEWNKACQPPWSERELEHKVDDALRQPGWRGHLLAGPGRRVPASRAIDRANRHAVEHRRRALRRSGA